jgi:hypothetical protein
VPRGFVYVLTNRAMPGLIKIGFSTRHPNERATELSTTGVPFSFEVASFVEVDDPSQMESEIHKRLAKHRVSENREFFRVAVERAVAIVGEVCGGPFGADCDLSPRAASSDGSYFERASRYYPQSVSFTVERPEEDHTWIPDPDFARTYLGRVVCPHCQFVFELKVSEALGFLPPPFLPCTSCRKTIRVT